jgi:hypothetical protein
MKKHLRWMLFVAITSAMIKSGFGQVASSAPVPVKIQVVLSQGEGDRKVSSPFSFFLSTSGESAALRIGAEVTVANVREQLGTQIESQVTSPGDGRFQMMVNFIGRYIAGDGKLREVNATNTFTLRDAESTKFSGTDSSGAAFTLDVTLTVVK